MDTVKIASLFDVSGKVALVTGGSRGIGLMIARAYAANGVRVYITSRKRDACEAAERELGAIGECIAIPADLSNAEGRAALVATLSAREDRLDILVNNAGTTWGAPFTEYPEDGFDKVLDTNLKAPFFLTRELLPLLEAGGERGSARIINIGSIDGINVPRLAPNYAYGPSKAAVHHLTRVLAVLLGRRNIRVNAIAPGPFDSKMTEWTLTEYRDQIISRCPVGRIGRPDDMAGIALYLASPGADYLNGVVIPLDGGISIENGNMSTGE
ncbi:SDR family oxidoreductase [Sphingomonas colocasiae]|uniref:SDR family oxidoreductase n=2 Tax=Sphingomonas colocasiae TaxID=1848973 RepID=A0ABS7PSB0_9SPHN|nr:SDR family oxidoreductase [Sphingomonas colocasiae]MBY8823560.1 SDR family oxidoreductase [Sphingomonas colocasiae]